MLCWQARAGDDGMAWTLGTLVDTCGGIGPETFIVCLKPR